MNENPNKKKLSEQLPSHSVNPGSWQRLSAKLDAMDAETAYYKNLEQLPMHAPDEGSWNIIYNRLNRIAFAKAAKRFSLTAAAGLLLFFSVSRISDNRQPARIASGISPQEQAIKLTTLPALPDPSKPAASQQYQSPISDRNKTVIHPANPAEVFATVIQETTAVENAKEQVKSGNEIALAHDPTVTEKKITEYLIKSPVTSEVSFPVDATLNTPPETKSILFEKEQNSPVASSPLLYTDPNEPAAVSKISHFSVAMEYLPENIANGTGTSLFHNVDLAASYTKNKLRVNTSLGMAYNQDQVVFDMNYDIQSAITAYGPGGKLDTLGYSLDKIESQYQGTEKHQYFTYNLGIGGRLFSFGKFSSWVNVGTGFGFSLNNPDLISATANSIKAQYNTLNASVNTSEPAYSDMYINLTTGINFNYRILNKLSLSVTPLSRWYFKPVLTQNNKATDDVTFGFSTGIKYDF